MRQEGFEFTMLLKSLSVIEDIYTIVEVNDENLNWNRQNKSSSLILGDIVLNSKTSLRSPTEIFVEDICSESLGIEESIEDVFSKSDVLSAHFDSLSFFYTDERPLECFLSLFPPTLELLPPCKTVTSTPNSFTRNLRVPVFDEHIKYSNVDTSDGQTCEAKGKGSSLFTQDAASSLNTPVPAIRPFYVKGKESSCEQSSSSEDESPDQKNTNLLQPNRNGLSKDFRLPSGSGKSAKINILRAFNKGSSPEEINRAIAFDYQGVSTNTCIENVQNAKKTRAPNHQNFFAQSNLDTNNRLKLIISKKVQNDLRAGSKIPNYRNSHKT